MLGSREAVLHPEDKYIQPICIIPSSCPLFNTRYIDENIVHMHLVCNLPGLFPENPLRPSFSCQVLVCVWVREGDGRIQTTKFGRTGNFVTQGGS